MELQSKDTALLFKITHSKPVEMNDFVETMKSLQILFEEFAKGNADSSDVRKAKLYVEKIEHGSIEIFLTEVITASVLPFIENFNLIWEFALHLRGMVSDAVAGREEARYSIQELKALRGLFSVNASDARGETEFGAIRRDSPEAVFNSCTFNFYESNTAQNQISRQLERRLQDEPSEIVHKSQLMKIYQMRGDIKANAGNRAVVDALHPKSLPVYFVDDVLKAEILGSQENPTRKAFVVDVIMQTIEGSPSTYKVVALHEVIPLDD